MQLHAELYAAQQVHDCAAAAETVSHRPIQDTLSLISVFSFLLCGQTDRQTPV